MSFNPKQTLTIIYFHVFIIVLPLFVFRLNFFKVCLTMSHFLYVKAIKSITFTCSFECWYLYPPYTSIVFIQWKN